MSDARCPCECENPCVLNEDLDQAEQRIAKLEAVLGYIRDTEILSEWEMRQIAREALE